jgi:tRNA/tmRNA/rRNA uracil-C5-methylase (TrmA/RlmC/RlmD family)
VPNDQVSVEIDSLAPGGDAVGRQQGGEGGRAADDGRVTLVALAAPGERVRARIEREKGKVAWGELTAIERPGADRVPPPICAYCSTDSLVRSVRRTADEVYFACDGCEVLWAMPRPRHGQGHPRPLESR